MGIADLLRERKEVRDAFRNLRSVIQEARPNGITAEEAADIAEATVELVSEVCDLVQVGLAHRDIISSAIKTYLRPTK